MINAPHQRLTIFQEDDVTPLLGTVDGSGNVLIPTCSTEPAAARPYLQRTMELAESSIDFIEGSAIIGALRVSILDKRTVAADQTTGWLTAILAGVDGNNHFSGYRCLVEQQADDGSWYYVLNGVITDISLKENYVEYDIEIKDMRERERDVPLFNKSPGNLSLYPPGVTAGYGRINGLSSTLLAPVTKGVRAVFRRDPTVTACGIAEVVNQDKWLTSDIARKLMDISSIQVRYDGSGNPTLNYEYTYVGMRWRPWGSTGAYTTLINMPYYPNAEFTTHQSAFIATDHDINGQVAYQWAPWLVLSTAAGVGLPTNGQEIEVMMTYYGPPTEDTPIIIELGFGQLLKDSYDGVYSTESPKIKYDTAVMAGLVTSLPPARVKITEPAPDLREWVQENIYKILGYAPALNLKGEITPIKYALPDASVTLVQLDDTNVTGANWVHSSKDVKNKTIFKYIREVQSPLDTSVPNTSIYSVLLREREIEIIDIHTSAALFGPKTVEYNPVTVRSFGNSGSNAPITGNIMDELGAQLARARSKELFDRFSYGAQRIMSRALRSDTAVASLHVGDWVMIASSYLPDYVTKKRGINRIAQIVNMKDVSPIEREMELLDGGPFVVPLAQPTLGALSTNAGRIQIPIASIPVGAEARVDYAINPTNPGTNSGMWRFAARTSVVGNVYTPTIPVGQVVWVRARSEATARRPSAYTTPVNITMPASPVISGLKLTIRDSSNPIVTWNPESASFGYRVWWQVYKDGDALTAFSDFVDIRADVGTVTLPSTMRLRQFENIVLAIDPYNGWTGTAITGTAGQRAMLRGKRLNPTYIQPSFEEQQTQTLTDGTLTLVENDPQFRIDKVEFRHQEGIAGTFSAWAEDTTSPFSDTVSLLSGDTSTIEYRFYEIDQTGTSVLRVTSGVKFVQGADGSSSLSMRLRQFSADDTTMEIDTYIADTVPQAGVPIVVKVSGQGVAAVVAEDGSQAAVFGSRNNMLGSAANDLAQWTPFTGTTATPDGAIVGPDGALGGVWRIDVVPSGGGYILKQVATGDFNGVTLSGRVWAKAAVAGTAYDFAAIRADGTQLVVDSGTLTTDWVLYDFSGPGAVTSTTLSMLLQFGQGTFYVWAPALIRGVFADVTNDLDTTDFVRLKITRPPRQVTARNIVLESDTMDTAPWTGTDTATDNSATFAGRSFSLLDNVTGNSRSAPIDIEDDGVHSIGCILHSRPGFVGTIEVGIRDTTTSTDITFCTVDVEADGTIDNLLFSSGTGGEPISLARGDDGIYKFWFRTDLLDSTHGYEVYSSNGESCDSYYISGFMAIAGRSAFPEHITTTTSPVTSTADNPSGLVTFTAKRKGGSAVAQSIIVEPSGALGEPVPLIVVEGEATSRSGNGQGQVRLLINFDEKTHQVDVYASESINSAGKNPVVDSSGLCGSVVRQEGSIASDDKWQTEFDIGTTTSWYRQISAFIYGGRSLSKTSRLPPIKFFEQRAIDVGTGPSASPTGLTVVMSTVNGTPRAAVSFTAGDASASHRVFRNEIMLIRLPPGEFSFVDDGLIPDKTYVYKVQAVKNGQTSEFAGGAGSGGTGGTSGTVTLIAPSFASGYPSSGGYILGPDPYVNIRVNNPNPGAETEVWMSPGASDSGTFIFAGTVSAGLTDMTLYAASFGLSSGALRYFYLVATKSGYTNSPQSSHLTGSFYSDAP